MLLLNEAVEEFRRRAREFSPTATSQTTAQSATDDPAIARYLREALCSVASLMTDKTSGQTSANNMGFFLRVRALTAKPHLYYPAVVYYPQDVAVPIAIVTLMSDAMAVMKTGHGSGFSGVVKPAGHNRLIVDDASSWAIGATKYLVYNSNLWGSLVYDQITASGNDGTTYTRGTFTLPQTDDFSWRLSAIDNFYEGLPVRFYSGTQAGRTYWVYSYTASTRTFVLDRAWEGTAPSVDDFVGTVVDLPSGIVSELWVYEAMRRLPTIAEDRLARFGALLDGLRARALSEIRNYHLYQSG